MTSKVEKERAKLVQEKCQEILTDLLRDDDNKYCVDCDAKGPRWASWNLGIFLCIRCAGIHRNLGVHISKVKSINLDAWTPEQVGSIQQMGNSKARAVYEANLPDGHRRPQTDSALESFIRAKYEHRKYIAREWVPPPLAPAFDIEEEVKKDKEKRRQTSKPAATGIRGPSGAASSVTSDQNNSVPRPVCSHPASTTISAEKVPKDSPALSLSGSRSNNDLLGINFGSADSGLLDNNNQSDLKENLKGSTGSASDGDLFAAFSESGRSNQPKSAKDEEADFFNQKAPDVSKKLDMNSILKLYDSSPTTGPLFGAPAMNPQQQQLQPQQLQQQQQLNQQQQLPYGLQTNPIQPPFGTFPPAAGLVQAPGLIQQSLVSGGLLPTGTPLGQNLTPFGPPVVSVTNPFLSTAASTPAASMSGFPMSQPSSTVHQMNQQLGSLELNSHLVSNWLGTSLSSAASTMTPLTSAVSSTPAVPPASAVPSSVATSGLFSGLNGSLSKNQKVPESTAPVTSANPFLSSTQSSTTSTNGVFSETSLSFPPSFPTDGPRQMAPAGSLSQSNQSDFGILSQSNQSDFGNLNWANFNQPIPTGGPSSAPPASVLPSSDLWQ